MPSSPFFEYAATHWDELLLALRQHLIFVGVALGFSIAICVPLGIWTSRPRSRARARAAAETVMNIVNGMRVIPSLAVLFLLIPYLGLSFGAAVFALTLLALPPILINTDAGFRTVDAAVRESARGMGMTARQILWQIEFPLALPVILTGIRTAMVEVIASATLAAFIGGGGLGTFIVRGFAMYDAAILLLGAIPVALLALLAEVGMSGLQRLAEPPRWRFSRTAPTTAQSCQKI
ncbi:MAG: ABC transporter permease [Anaerolineales bacterium]